MSTRRLTVYEQTITKEFAFLKNSTTVEDLMAKGLGLPKAGGLLVPLSTLHGDDPALPGEIAGWNAEASTPLPAAATTESAAAAWVTQLLNTADQLGWLVLDRHARRQGLVVLQDALNPAMEIRVGSVAGSARCLPLLEEALGVVCEWARTTLWPESLAASARPEPTPFTRVGFVRQADRLVYRPGAETVGASVILTAGPSISAREASYAHRAVKYGWNREWNGYLSAFEKAFADYIGVRHALATSSCTGALHIALTALGIGPGDEVIVPDITWVATANAVLYVGATPIFADVELDSWCLDPRSFESKITPRTKAVMPVHLYGHPTNMEAVMSIANRHGLAVVEDAAPSIGAEFKGRRTGSFGHFACFSFQGAKLAVTGEGGMLLTNDPQLHERAYSVWDQGRKPGTFWIQSNGLKYKMANALAALGLGQLERNHEMVEAKRRIFDWYAEGLENVPHLTLNRESPWARSIYWMSSIRLDEAAPVGRDALREALKQRRVDTRSVFPAISQYPIWPVKQTPQPVAWRIGQQAINLPSGVCLTRDEVAYVCRCIRQILGQPD